MLPRGATGIPTRHSRCNALHRPEFCVRNRRRSGCQITFLGTGGGNGMKGIEFQAASPDAKLARLVNIRTYRPPAPAPRIKLVEAAQALSAVTPGALGAVQDISPSLARILRPQSAYRWLLPYLASITPQYVESILRGALAGNHVQAWELFDLMVDTNPEIRSCIGEYVDGITAKKLIIEPYHEEDASPTSNAIRNQKVVSAALRNLQPDPANFENALRSTMTDIVFCRFHNQSVLEADYYEADRPDVLHTLNVAGVGRITAPRCTFWVHPVCYAWSMEGRLGLRVALTSQIRELTRTASLQKPGQWSRSSGGWEQKSAGRAAGSMTEPPAWNWMSSQPMPSYLQEFPPNKFLIATWHGKAGTAMAQSDLRPLAAWWVYENFSADYAMDMAQIFGIPFRTAYYEPGSSEEDKSFVREMLQNMGSRGWALLPSSVKLEFEEAMKSGAETPSGYLIKLCQEQYRKVILRQTMTGMGHGGASSGSKAGMLTEQEVKAICIQAGADFVADVLRDQFARYILRINGLPDDELPFIRLAEEQEGSLQDMQRDQIGAQLIDIGENYFRRKYGYPKPAPGEKSAKAAVAKTKGGGGGGLSPSLNPDPAQTMDAALEMEAAAADGAPPRAAIAAAAQAVADTVSPLVEYLRAGLDIQDPSAQRQFFQRALKLWPELTGPLQHDGSMAAALAPELVKSFIAGLHGEAGREKKEISASRPRNENEPQQTT